jgi:predicted ester cyclase
MKNPFPRRHRALIAAVWLMGCAVSAHAQSVQAPPAQVQALLQKHYGGYAAGGQPGVIFAQTALPTWSNCSANGTNCQTREELVGALEQGLHKLIPDMRWEILEMISSGDKVIVRGQGSGTPVGPFMGVPATGKRFQIMSIDIHTLQDGKIAHTHHLEDWAAALGQLAGR